MAHQMTYHVMGSHGDTKEEVEQVENKNAFGVIGWQRLVTKTQSFGTIKPIRKICT